LDITDAERLQVLARSKLLDSGSEEAYDRFTKLAAVVLNVPVSLVSLVDKDRQYFKSYYGLPEPWASQQQTPLSHSFCQYVVSFRQPLIVKDAREEALLEHSLAIPDLGVVAYLGFPLVVENQPLGSFCVIDTEPHAWSEREIKIVQELASFVTTEITLRMEIAERQKVTEQLLESEERFRTLANQAPMTIWQADASGAATFLNTAWSTLTGLSVADSLGIGWINAVHPDDQARTLTLWMQTLAATLPYHTEYRLRRADGAYREVVAYGSAYTDQQGAFLGYIGTLLDVTEQRELDRQREMFLSITTHELKTPLTAVQGNIQLAQRRLKDLFNDGHGLSDEQQTTLSKVISMLARGMENLQMQTRLINDLQDLSRIQAKKLEFHKSPCDLVELVRQTVLDQQVAYPQRVVTFEFPSDVPCIVLADAQRTRQVLSNYLNNAFKYSPPEQPVHVEISIETASARVWVRDHGIGLSPEQQAHIWERFYQAHETPVHTGTPGLGLGLHICRALIREQQGEVGVESVKEQGSAFWFSLPLFQAVPSQE
jgi:PAS domain S-box-containing protein